MLSKIRAVSRLFFFAFGALFYVGRYLIKVPFTGPDVDRGIRLRKQFSNIFLPALGVRIAVSGTFPEGGGLLVCNHRSYVDPFLLLKDIPAMPVGKAAVATWPIIGIAGRVSGAIFVDRSSAESRMKARQDIAAAIREGYFIINYPEGTTHDQASTISFKPGMFYDAVKEKFPVYPIALEYQQTSDFWVGDDTFIRHFLACFSKAQTQVRVHYGDAIYETDPQRLMEMAKDTIDQQLKNIRENWFEKARA